MDKDIKNTLKDSGKSFEKQLKDLRDNRIDGEIQDLRTRANEANDEQLKDAYDKRILELEERKNKKMTEEERKKSIDDFKEKLERDIKESVDRVSQLERINSKDNNALKDAILEDDEFKKLNEQKDAVRKYEVYNEFFDKYKEILDRKNANIDGDIRKSDLIKLQELGATLNDDELLDKVNGNISDGRITLIDVGSLSGKGGLVDIAKSMPGRVKSFLSGKDYMEAQKNKEIKNEAKGVGEKQMNQ